jgi:hypothetical protein
MMLTAGDVCVVGWCVVRRCVAGGMEVRRIEKGGGVIV